MKHSEQIKGGFARGNPQAFTALYNEMYSPLFWFAYKFVENNEDAEDIIADVFYKLWQNSSELRDIENLPAYLRKMTRNACLNFLERNKLKAGIYKDLLQRSETSTEEDFTRSDVKSEVLSFVNTELKKLSPKYRTVFDMAFVHGMKNEEVADKLKTSNQVVRDMKTKIRKMLKVRILSPTTATVLVFLFL
ncbi:MAG TPA: sigma-70 family RNA polymerase sigma factor [Puia sp.]|jgi:RNA polymerase sigma-70 factor (ECF subfamily)